MGGVRLDLLPSLLSKDAATTRHATVAAADAALLPRLLLLAGRAQLLPIMLGKAAIGPAVAAA